MVVYRVKKIIAWILAIVIVFLLASGLWWVITLL